MAPAEVDFRRVARAGRQDGAEVHARAVGGGGGASGGALRSLRGRRGQVWGEGVVGGEGVGVRARAAAGVEVGVGGSGVEAVGGVGGCGEGEEGEGEEGEGEGEGEEVHGFRFDIAGNVESTPGKSVDTAFSRVDGYKSWVGAPYVRSFSRGGVELFIFSWRRSVGEGGKGRVCACFAPWTGLFK